MPDLKIISLAKDTKTQNSLGRLTTNQRISDNRSVENGDSHLFFRIGIFGPEFSTFACSVYLSDFFNMFSIVLK